MSGVLRISLLGQPSVEADSHPIRIASHKAQALLWYLAAQPDREFSRTHLASLLWMDSPEHVGRQSLSTTLNRLRQTLPCWPIEAGSDHLRWKGCEDVWVDTTRFMELWASPTDPVALAEAADLWRGPFLEGYAVPNADGYEAWMQYEGQLWENRVLQVLTNLVQSEQALGRWPQAIAYARRALLIDPLQERFHQTLMTCLYLSGDRGAALSQYAACERLIRGQLGVEPDDSTRQLRDSILAGTLPRVALRSSLDRVQGRVQIAGPQDGPLAGRQEELARLRADLRPGDPAAKPAVLINGEVGLGKSRLVRELLNLREPAPIGTVLRTSCQASWRGPLWPMLEAVHMRLPPADLEGQHLQLTQAVVERLASLPGPVLLVIEDLHWADEDTCGMLNYLVRHPWRGHLSLLLTSRSWELPEALYMQLRQWEGEGLLAWLDLRPLPSADFAALVRSRCPQAEAAFIHLMREETNGVPLIAVAMLDALAQEPEAELPTSSHQLPLPPYLVSLVRGRILGLSAEAVQLLDIAALRQEGVSLNDLERLTGLETRVVLDGLDALLGSGLVTEDPNADRIRVPLGFVRRAVAGMVSQTRLRHLRASLEHHGRSAN